METGQPASSQPSPPDAPATPVPAPVSDPAGATETPAPPRRARATFFALLRVLLVAAKQSKAVHCKLALCSLKAQVRDVFDISGFGTIIALHPDRDSALAAAR